MISVLYVDDEPDLLVLAQLFLEQSGEFTVGTSVSAQEVLDSGSIPSYDAIISDYQMPGMDGVDFLKTVRERYGSIPFILFTGRGREEVVIQAINNGADFYLQKGGDPTSQFAELANKIRYAVARKRAERELQRKNEELNASYEQIAANEEELRQQLDELTAKQEALLNSEEKFRAFTENIPDLTTIVDASGHYMYISPSIQRLTGRQAEELLGKDFAIITTLFGIPPEDVESLRESGRKAIQKPGEAVPAAPFRLRDPAGNLLYFEGTNTYLPDVKGIQGIVFHGREITDRIGAEQELLRKTEELNASYEQLTASDEELRGQYEELAFSEKRIRESEERFRGIFEKTHDALVLFTEDGCIDCNRQAVDLFGFSSREEMIGLRPEDVSPPLQPDGQDSRAASISLMKTVFERGTIRIEWLQQRKDKSTFLADALLSAFELDGKRVFISSIRDITEKRRTEEELELLKISVERSTDELFWLDFTGSILYVNDAACRISGYSREELLAMKIFELDPDFPPSIWEASMADLREKKTRFITTRHRRKDGTLMDVEIVAVYVSKDRREYSFAFVRDITRRKRDERVSRDTIAFLDALIEQNPNPVWIADNNGFLVRMNAACSAMLGGSQEELAGKYNILEDNLVEEQGFMPLVRSVFENGEVVSFTLRYDSARLTTFPLKKKVSLVLFVTIFPIRDADGKITHAVIIHKDITEEDRTRQVLAESEERYRTLVDSSFDGILINQDGIIVYANRTAARLLGSGDMAYPVGKPALGIIHPDDRPKVAERIRQAGEQMLELRAERFLRADGTSLDTDVAATPCTWQGRPAIYVTFRDITDRVRAEEALFRSREMLTTVLDAIPQRVFWKDRNSFFLGCNKQNAMDAGFTDPADLVGKTDYDYTSREIAEQYRADDRRVMETGQPKINYEEPLVRPDGSMAWLRTSKVPLHDRDGNVIGVLGTYEDITDYKRNIEALRESEEKYRTLVENANEAIAIVQDGKILFVNHSGARILGIPESDIVGKQYLDFIWPDDSGKIRQLHEDRVAGKTVPATYDYRVKGPGGNPVWIFNSTATITWEGRPATLSLLTDITARKAAEEKLREREETSRTLIEGAPEAIFISTEQNLVYLNPAALQLFGAGPGDQLIGTPTLDRIHPRFRDTAKEQIRRLFEDRAPSQPAGMVYLRLDGTEVDVEVSSVPFRFLGSDSALVFVRNISDRKQAEREQRESEEKYRHILENMQDAYIRTDTDRTIVMVSPSAAHLYGYDAPGEMIGLSSSVLYNSPEEQQELLSKINRQGKVTDFTGKARRRDGTRFWVSVNVQYLFDATGSIAGIEAIVRDISERKVMEQAIQEANRKLSLLNSITRHDVVNQLTSLQGYAQLAGMRSADPVVSDFLSKIGTSAETIARQLEFARTYQDLGAQTPSWSRIRDVVSRAGRAEVTFSQTCLGMEVLADPMLEKVFFNLFDNAIRHGERVTQISVRCERAPDGLVIIIEDDGIGIPPEEKEKIFSKGYGKNSGFGLFLAREILAITGITIRETGYAGIGARFEITVPREQWRIVPGQ